MNEDPWHGVDGWELLSYHWQHTNNVGRFEYERKLETGKIEHRVVDRYQPGYR